MCNYIKLHIKLHAPWAFHCLKGKQILPLLVSECATQKKDHGPYPLLSFLQMFQSYNAPALSPFIRSYLRSFDMNYITFRTVEIGKPYLFEKKKLWRKKNVLICTRIYFFTWNLQNKIIIEHWDVELPSYIVFLFFKFLLEY